MKHQYLEQYKSIFFEASIGSHHAEKTFELYRKLLQTRLKTHVYTSGTISDIVLKDGKKVGGVIYYIGADGEKRIRVNTELTSNSVKLHSIDFWHSLKYNPDLTLYCDGLSVIQLLDLIVDTVNFGEPMQTQIFTEGSKQYYFKSIGDWMVATNTTLDSLKTKKIKDIWPEFEKWDSQYGKTGLTEKVFKGYLGLLLRGKGIINSNAVEVSIVEADSDKRVLTPEEKETQDELIKYLVNEKDLKQSIALLKELIQGIGVLTKGIILTGTPGIGKTYTTIDVLENMMGKQLDFDYVLKEGAVTPIILFKTLHDNRDKVCIFDECDAMLKNPDCINMLKHALQTQGKRRVSYNKENIAGKKDEEGEAIWDNPFEFEGSIILITNLKAADMSLVDPVMDRINLVNFNISQEDLLIYISEMLTNIYQDVNLQIKQQAFDFFKKLGPHYKSARTKGISIRAYTKTLDLILAGLPEASWKKLAINTL